MKHTQTHKHPHRSRMKAAGVAIVSLAFVLVPPAHMGIDAANMSCEGLASLQLRNAKVTAAIEVPAGTFTPPAVEGGRGVVPPAAAKTYAALPAFCRVQATATPTSDSDIKIEVWLPVAGWNGKFQAVGNGGWNGAIDQNALAAGVRRGYAVAAT